MRRPYADSARAAAGGVGFDIVAESAYLRSGENSGAFVGAPNVGQAVVFHGDWRVDGVGGPVVVGSLALLDGQPFCIASGIVEGGDSLISFCAASWTATPGAHTLRWQFDFAGEVGEVDEGNNETQTQWVSSVASPSPTRTRSVTVTRTASVSASPTRSRTPSRSPTSSATATLGSPTPTRTLSSDVGFFARGDSDCSASRGISDVVLATRALGGAAACGNDDCNRDGRVSGDDVECTARCLFGACPPTAQSPQLVSVGASSAANIVPGSVFTIRGGHFGDGATVRRVTVGGVDASVVEENGGMLSVVAPLLPAGPAQVVVHAGELSSAATQIDLGSGMPIGPRDRLADLLRLLDELTQSFAASNLSAVYDAGDVPAVMAALDSYRDGLHAVALDDPGLDSALAAEIDAVVDASGVPELLRSAIAAIEAAGVVPRGGRAAGGTLVVAQFGRAVRAGSGLTQVITPALGTRALAATLLRSALGGVVAAVAVTVLVEGGSAVLAPVMIALQFVDESGAPRQRPTAAGRVHVTTRGNLTGIISLLATTAYGTFRRGGSSCGTGCVDFTLPDAPGFCGAVGLRLARGPIEGRDSIGTTIQPEIIDVDPTAAAFADNLDLYARGVAPCPSRVGFEGPLEGRVQRRLSDLTIPGLNEDNHLRTAAGVPVDGRLRELPPGRHKLSVDVQDVASIEPFVVRLRTAINGMAINCAPTALALAPAAPSAATCVASPLPATVEIFPVDTRISWQSNDVSVIDAGASEPPPQTTVLAARRPGSALVTAAASAAEVPLAVAAESVPFSVEDRSPPRLIVLRLPDLDPGCGDFVLQGGSERIFVGAEDNYLTTRLRVLAPPGVLRQTEQLFVCLPGAAPDPRACSEAFTLEFLPDATPGEALIRIESSDAFGNTVQAQCPYEIVAGPLSPTPAATATPTMTPTMTPTAGPILARFLKIADRQTDVPAGTNTFSTFSEPAVDNGFVAFVGLQAGGSALPGIYGHDGEQLDVLADRETVMPGEVLGGQPRKFSSFHYLAVDDGMVAFSGGLRGLLFSMPASFGAAVQRFIDLPHFPPGDYGFPECLSLSAGRAAFLIDDSPNNSAGVYLARGPVRPDDLSNLVRIADGTTAIPGGGGNFSFTSLIGSSKRSVASDGDTVAFLGADSGGQLGVYRARAGGAVEAVADNAGGQLDGVCAVAVDADDVAFVSSQGVFVQQAGAAVVAVATRDTPVPGAETRRFGRFLCALGFDAGAITFTAEVTAAPVINGLYLWESGTLRRLLANGDMLDGKLVSNAAIEDDQAIDARSDGASIDIATVVRVNGNEPILYRVTFGP